MSYNPDPSRFIFRPAQLSDIPSLKKCAKTCFCVTHERFGQPADELEQYTSQAYHPDVLTKEITSQYSHYEVVIDRSRLSPEQLQKELEYEQQHSLNNNNNNNNNQQIKVDNNTDDTVINASTINTSTSDNNNDDFIIGYCKMTWGEDQTDPTFRNTPQTIQQQRLYILPEYHGAKLGKSLQRWAIDFATKILPSQKQHQNQSVNNVNNDNNNQQQQEPMFTTMWLTTHHLNDVAVQFYLRWGFEITGEYYFVLRDRRDKNHIMQLKLI